jgi:hypothetical protein
MQLCCTCNVSQANAGRMDIVCNRVWVADVQHLLATGSKEEIKNIAQRPGFNSFYQIDYGGNLYGIFSMIHTEGLHAIEVGLCKYMMEILFEELPKQAKQELDTILVKCLLQHPKQHGFKAFPRLLWQDRVTNLTKLTGDQRMGKMLAIVAMALTLEGEKFFTKYLSGARKTWDKYSGIRHNDCDVSRS